LDNLKTIPNTNADNALILGTALHLGLEKGVEEAINYYYGCFPVIDDTHINEAIKLEYLIPKAKTFLSTHGIFEFSLKAPIGNFVGYIDYLEPVGENTYNLYDFKYSNNQDHYMDSQQLHVYKFFFERLNHGKKIDQLYYLFIPKANIKQKKTESLVEFRKRIKDHLEASEIELVNVEYDPEKVIDYYMVIHEILSREEYPKEKSYLCNWCEYQDYCMKGEDYMLLPSTDRRNIEKIDKKVVWIYGAPFSGKTFLANKFPDPLMLNTDGNIRFVDAPFIAIKDQVTVEGRQTKRTMSWEVFKEVLDELEKKQNEFKTLVVDLLEDVYEHCRIYIYDREGITHESDNSFKYYDVVRTEFLSTLKRLMNLDYENIILISHEDTSKDITKKSGDKITAIKPNLPDKVANKVAGMVDIVARVVADGDERTLSFKTNEVIFGGGRLSVNERVIPLDYDEFLKVYDEANSVLKSDNRKPKDSPKTEVKTEPKRRSKALTEALAETAEKHTDSEVEAEEKIFPKEVQEIEPEVVEATTVEATNEPKVRTRKRRQA
jgi:phage nucleotide-binding protein